ncbi:hypothetical protein HC891_22350 [Candidatus Gracilibacteria bacterium]|nr:hypothetical protein [Candidatus Gracilibacteria bacterium]
MSAHTDATMFVRTILCQTIALLGRSTDSAHGVEVCTTTLQHIDAAAYAVGAAELAQLAASFRQRTATARRLRNAVSDQIDNTVDHTAIARYRQEYEKLTAIIAECSTCTRLIGALARLLDPACPQDLHAALIVSAKTAYCEAVALQP